MPVAMEPAAVRQPTSPTEGEATLVDTLPRPSWHLGFPAAVEARFEADTGAARSRELLTSGLVAMAIYDAFLINDAFTRPEVMAVAVWWRLGVVSVFGLAVLALIRRGLPPLWREAAMASTTLVALFGACMIFRATTSPAGAFDPFMFSLVLLAGNIVFRLRFVTALVASVLQIGMVAAFLAGPSVMPDVARPFVMSLMLATGIFTVLACHRLERAERRAYLLVLRESTRSQVALQAAGRYATLSQTDALTQLPNRRAFDEALPQRWDEAARQGQPMAALLVDIDHFKRFNDRFGHPAGDDCLRRVAQLMRQALRDDDFIARIGGEEFAVLLRPGTEAMAEQLAERIRRQVVDAQIPHDGGDGQPVVSVSLGLAVTGPLSSPSSQSPLSPQSSAALIEAADAALYAAKRQGRNRCVRHGAQAEATA